MYNFRIYDTQSEYDQDKNIVYPELSLIKDTNSIVSKSNNGNKSYVLQYDLNGYTGVGTGKTPLITRCDLFKSIKVNGEEISLIDKVREPIKFTTTTNDEMFNELIGKISTEEGDILPEYVVFLPSEQLDGTIEVTWNDNIESLYGAFLASPISYIPENLLDEFTEFTSMMAVFMTSSLRQIPGKLFSKLNKVTNFESTFSDCQQLTGICPIDDDGTPIYNRSGSGKEGYAVITDFSGCFQGCTGMSDYNSIPSSWGGGKA